MKRLIFALVVLVGMTAVGQAQTPVTDQTIELSFSAAQTDVAVVTATASQRIIVTSGFVACADTVTVSVNFRVGFGLTTTPTTTGVIATNPGFIPSTNGAVVPFPTGATQGTAGQDVRLTASVPTGGSCRVLVRYRFN